MNVNLTKQKKGGNYADIQHFKKFQMAGKNY